MIDWIPVEEKLPENHDLVIVTHECYGYGHYCVNEAEFEDGEFFSTRYTDDLEDEILNVIAWMPYPTSYIKGGKLMDNYYFCDPEKNTECSKELCYVNGGPCKLTSKAECKKPTTNQDKIAEMVRTMSPEKLADIISVVTENACMPCDYACPVPTEYCNRYFKMETDTYDIKRVPDEDDNILNCHDILVKWLKEEN